VCSKLRDGPAADDGLREQEIPDHLPPSNQGAIPVVVRLVDEQNGVHYRPAEARRWNRTHVMVALRDVHPDTGQRCDTLAWLRAEDVYRVLHAEDVRRA
jgi:hypothetical protein